MVRVGNKSKKLAVLGLIKEKKSVLFGSTENNATTKAEKQKAWKEVMLKARSLGLVSANRDWCYVRDHIFGQWKSRSLVKREKAKKTSTDGERRAVMDEVDDTILEIVGTDSTVSKDLPKRDGNESTTTCSSEAVELGLTQSDSNQSTTLNSNTTCSPAAVELNLPERDGNHSTTFNTPTNENRIQKRKIEPSSITILKMQVLESEYYRNQLQILELEKKLNIPPSKFTSQFGNKSSNETIQLELRFL